MLINFKGAIWQKNRLLVKNALYDWYDWLINHIPDSIKKSTSNAIEKIICLFEITNNDQCKPKNLMVCLVINTLNIKVIKVKLHQLNDILKGIFGTYDRRT